MAVPLRVEAVVELDHVLGVPRQVHNVLPADGTGGRPSAIDVGEVRHLRILPGVEHSGLYAPGVRDRNQGMPRALRIARAARGHDRAKVERDAGIGRGSLGEYEKGHRDPDDPTVRKIARALGISETTLVTLSLSKEERDRAGEENVDRLALQAFQEFLQ